MAIVEFKCDTCKRTIQLQRNIEGLEKIQRCTITHGCRGKIYQVNVYRDYIRGELPDDVEGLDNWVQRKVLHTHFQAIERDEWVVQHNMGTNPIVSVYVDRPIEGDLENREKITPEDIVIVDKNSIIIRFDRPWSGLAQLVGRQSDPALLQPTERATTQAIEPYQMSLSGEITIATRISSIGDEPSISLLVEYDTSQTRLQYTYAADDQPSINSAWVDYDRIVVRGKLYTVRSFNALVPEMVSGAIGNGAQMRFVGVDSNNDQTVEDINRGDILILLASEPFQSVDKIQDKFIDVNDAVTQQNISGLFYNSGEFFADPTIVKTIYPTIRSV